MEEQETIHYLKVLVELQLYPILRIITEGSFSKEEITRRQQEQIVEFIKKLPNSYKTLTNRNQIIEETLKSMNMYIQLGQEKRKTESNIGVMDRQKEKEEKER